jgi:cell division septum initiation protein DivIVA
MASQKKIEANRRNARRSTGPRSSSGKERSSGNAYRHGLSRPPSGVEFERAVQALARQIAGATADRITLDYARVAAEAELELARVRRVKAALLERVVQLGTLSLPESFISPMAEIRFFAMMETLSDEKRRTQSLLRFATAKATMPTTEPERSEEATRRILTELGRLHRYESRAVSRRDRAIRSISQTMLYSKTRIQGSDRLPV